MLERLESTFFVIGMSLFILGALNYIGGQLKPTAEPVVIQDIEKPKFTLTLFESARTPAARMQSKNLSSSMNKSIQ